MFKLYIQIFLYESLSVKIHNFLIVVIHFMKQAPEVGKNKTPAMLSLNNTDTSDYIIISNR